MVDIVKSEFAKMDKVIHDGNVVWVENCRWNPWEQEIEYRLIAEIHRYIPETLYPEQYSLYRKGDWIAESELNFLEHNKSHYGYWNKYKVSKWRWIFSEEFLAIYSATIFRNSFFNKYWPCWLKRVYLLSFLVGFPFILVATGMTFIVISTSLGIFIYTIVYLIEEMVIWFLESWSCKC